MRVNMGIYHKDTEALEYVRAELGDVELQNGLRMIYRSFQGARTNHVTVEGQLINHTHIS